MKRLLMASTWFQIVWFCAVLGNDMLQTFTMILVVFTLLISACITSINWLKFSLIVAVGVGVDFANYSLGFFHFENRHFPLWLVGLWMIFVWYSYFLYPTLSQYPFVLVSIVGGIGGTLSYVGAERIGVVSFGVPVLTAAGILLIEWALMLAFILKVYRYDTRNSNNGVPSTDR